MPRKASASSAARRAACPLFWTLGGNQAGKAAIAGWRDILQPALLDPVLAPGCPSGPSPARWRTFFAREPSSSPKLTRQSITGAWGQTCASGAAPASGVNALTRLALKTPGLCSNGRLPLAWIINRDCSTTSTRDLARAKAARIPLTQW